MADEIEIKDTQINEKDHVVTAMAANGMVRIIGAETTALCDDARKIHGTSCVATAALGRTLTAAVLMSNQLKNETDSITLQIKGKGPLGTIVCVSDVHANVRGFVANPHVDLPIRESDGKLDVGKAVGKGFMIVIKDLSLKEPYMGTSELISGEIAEDISYYFALSEQVPSVCALGVRIMPDPEGKEDFVVERAGGYLLQLMPGATEDIISTIEQRVSMLPSVTTLLSAGATIENIIEDTVGPLGLEFTGSSECKYQCKCSRERMERALISIGEKDLSEIEADGKGAEISCQFCNTKYNFDTEEITRLLKSIKK